MTEVAVFLGPSLPRDEAAVLLPGATLLPPVRLGDVCAAVLDGFDVIVIVDGFFEQVPTVWHKEILWALSRGRAVYGASSMGALRAAELAPFGMCGVGRIFERFADGTYTDDDEVTIIHADDDVLGYRALSVAMASIREAVEEAVATGILAAAQAVELIARSKARHYSERCWPLVLRDARDIGVDAERTARLKAHVEAPGSDAKARDAAAVLRRVRDDLAAGTRPAPVAFEFEPTYNFEKLLTIVRAERAERGVARRLGAQAAEVRDRTTPAHLPLFQFLVDREARRLGLRPTVPAENDAPGENQTPAGVAARVSHLESFAAQLAERHRLELALFTETAAYAAGTPAAGIPAVGTPAAGIAAGVAEREDTGHGAARSGAGAAGRPGVAGASSRLRSEEGNRLDDGRVVR